MCTLISTFTFRACCGGLRAYPIEFIESLLFLDIELRLLLDAVDEGSVRRRDDVNITISTIHSTILALEPVFKAPKAAEQMSVTLQRAHYGVDEHHHSSDVLAHCSDVPSRALIVRPVVECLLSNHFRHRMVVNKSRCLHPRRPPPFRVDLHMVVSAPRRSGHEQQCTFAKSGNVVLCEVSTDVFEELHAPTCIVCIAGPPWTASEIMLNHFRGRQYGLYHSIVTAFHTQNVCSLVQTLTNDRAHIPHPANFEHQRCPASNSMHSERCHR